MIINGKEAVFENVTVQSLVSTLALQVNRIVVEVNGEIVSPQSYGTYWLTGDEVVEIVSFVGGG